MSIKNHPFTYFKSEALYNVRRILFDLPACSKQDRAQGLKYLGRQGQCRKGRAEPRARGDHSNSWPSINLKYSEITEEES